MNKNLNKAKKDKDDEYYTKLSDIENEINHYKDFFSGKTVYCNCDDPEWSSFFIYFKINFKILNLKKLITTHYTKNKEIDKAYKLECIEIFNENGIAIEKKTYLTGDGDFRSNECVELLKESDIVCTNPPFSLFIEYITQLIHYKKDFLIIGNFNSVSCKPIFKLIKENKIWIGVNKRNMQFYRNIEHTEAKKVNACWFTNIKHKKRNKDIILWQTYNTNRNKTYDNYDAINVDKAAEIPVDFNGKMGVPITFLENYNPTQFEIIGIDRELTEQTNGNPTRFYVEKKEKFARIVIKKR